jgi:hypothetical protein
MRLGDAFFFIFFASRPRRSPHHVSDQVEGVQMNSIISLI